MRKLLYGFIFCLLISLFIPKAYADTNFSTDYNVTYTVNSDASTHVSLNSTLTNLTGKYYAASYSIQVGFKNIYNITAYDSDGPITPSITKSSKGTTIGITFNRQVVGLNNKSDFNISFDTKEIANNFNNTWDINIPGISNQNDFTTFNVTVVYPSFLGRPTFIKPILLDQSANQNGNKLFFSKQDLGSSGISIAFGTFQIYDMNLKYHLENKNLFPVSTEIALPPSTNYQDVEIDSLNPKPVNVTEDKDGNWLAQYILKPSQTEEIDLTGKTKVYLEPREVNIDSSSLQDYLKPQTYWESDNPKIKDLANTLKTPYAIYQYVVKTLNYDFSRVQSQSPRLGAVGALNSPNSAVCLEFTDLFIALSRAAGIPAREIDGYGFSSNPNERPLSLVEDILHAWPEYYDFDKKTWVMVDPTWGNTTGGIDYFNILDFDHIAFVVKGENSNYPIPAGGYKLSSDINSKDVNVSIGSTFNIGAPKIQAEMLFPQTLISGLTSSGNIKISNLGNGLISRQTLSVSTNYLKPNDQTAIISEVPPYGYLLLPISFLQTPFLTNATDTIKITVGDTTTYKNIKIQPFFINKWFFIGGLLFVSSLIIISLAAYLFRRLSIFRRKE